MSTCIVCGHQDGACKPIDREIVTVSGVVKSGGPLRVPIVRSRVGKAGYQGNVELYDPKYPKLRMVGNEITGDESGETTPEVEAGAAATPAVAAPAKRTRKPK